MKVFHLCCLWLLCAVTPLFAGDWYESGFSFWQALSSFIICLAVLYYYHPTKWAKAFACVCLWQIALNSWDSAVDMNDLVYTRWSYVFAGLEFILLFGVGGFTELKRAYDDYMHTRASAHSTNSNG